MTRRAVPDDGPAPERHDGGLAVRSAPDRSLPVRARTPPIHGGNTDSHPVETHSSDRSHVAYRGLARNRRQDVAGRGSRRVDDRFGGGLHP